ncbi:MAG: hypothetical protein ACO1PI_08635 [Bacteroidota bacterium]
MKNYTKIFSVLFFALLAINTFAITNNEEILKKALEEYDNVLSQYKKIKGEGEKADDNKKITREQYKEIKTQIDKTIDLFDQYIRIGTSDASKKAARHYILVLKKYDFTFKNDLREFRDNYNKISSLESEMATLNGYYYPIQYSSGTKNYIINTDKRTSLEKGLLVEFLEVCTNLSKDADAVKHAKKGYAMQSYGDYNLWWCAHLWYFHSNKLNYTGYEMVEPSEGVIYAMSGLKRSDIKKIKDSGWINYTQAYYKLNSLLASNPSLSRNGEVWAKAGENFEKLDEEKWALEYYDKALKDGYGDRSFLLKMMEKGKSKKDKTLIKTAATIYDTKNLYSYGYCYDYKTIADYFDAADETTKAKELTDKYNTCQKEQTKQQRLAERGARFFVSFAPLPLLSGNIQGSVQIGGKRKLHEFGIRQVNEQRDRGLDMWGISNKNPENMIWSGMSYYYTYKKMSARDLYFGFQFRYTNKVYETLNATVTNANNNSYVGNFPFSPTEKRYDFTLNFGYMVVGKYLHLDMYYGFGLGFSTFDGGRNEWNNGAYRITNNTFLSERKETRIGFTPRMGLKIGLNLINK